MNLHFLSLYILVHQGDVNQSQKEADPKEDV